jgi:myo-inositol-1(or 4)-monophosphatase
MMNPKQLKLALTCATEAARAAGGVMTKNFRLSKKINEQQQHDIKLELDVRCQNLIEKNLRATFPEIPVLGEEGISGDPEGEYRWVVDPIDGTVNFTYEIPHACVSIALQRRFAPSKDSRRKTASEEYETLVGAVYDPFCDELFTAIQGESARLNGAVIHASKRRRLDETIVSIGFSKDVMVLEQMLPVFNRLVHRIRKVRIMGAAALAMVYVAAGRFDAYIEGGVRLWDIAAGGLILESAGGEFWRERVGPDEYRYRVLANNGLLRRPFEKLIAG